MRRRRLSRVFIIIAGVTAILFGVSSCSLTPTNCYTTKFADYWSADCREGMGEFRVWVNLFIDGRLTTFYGDWRTVGQVASIVYNPTGDYPFAYASHGVGVRP